MLLSTTRDPYGLRTWLYLNKRLDQSIGIKFYWWSRKCHISFEYDDERGWGGSFALPPIAFYLGWAPPKWLRLKENRTLQFAIHSWALWWELWRDDTSWSRGVPRWRSGNLKFLDLVLGKRKYYLEITDEREVLIPMPEKAYPATARLETYTYKRPRWFSKTIKVIDIEVAEGIPFEGKGENSWDCGHDAIGGFNCLANSIPEGVGKLVGNCLSSRVRHGDWNDWSWPHPTSTDRRVG